MIEIALALGAVNILGMIFLYNMINNNYAEDRAVKKNTAEISEKVLKLIEKEDAEYWKIFKKIIWKDNYLAERITKLEDDMKRNFKEDIERWLDEIDDDHAVYNKIMKEVMARIEEEVLAGQKANDKMYAQLENKIEESQREMDPLYKRLLFKLRYSPAKRKPNRLKRIF